MCPDKSPIYTTKIPLDEEETKKQKICSRTLLTCILATILIGLCVVLTIEFLYPLERKYRVEDIDEVRIYDGKEIGLNRLADHLFDDKGPWHLDFLINPTRLCETVNLPNTNAYIKDPEVKLLILVPSATSHFEHRKVIRKTWGSIAQEPFGPLRLGFVLGTTPNATETELIEQESVTHGDIIQANFEDTYRNLTTKSVLMLKWVSKYCAHAQYFLKADDDTFVNLHEIAKILQKDPYQSQDKFISGYVHKEALPYRSPDEKYYISEEDFPKQKFPPYASGSAYMSTGNTASQLYEASKTVKPFLSLEDIFVTGLCAEDIDAMLFHEPTFLYKDPPKPISWDTYSTYATAHSVTPDEIEQIWNEMTRSLFGSIFDSFGLPSFMFPDLNLFESLESEDSHFEDLFLFPNRNSGRILFDINDDFFNKILNIPGGQNLMDSINSSRMKSKERGSSRISLLDFPQTEVFNLTFFVRK
ncbi:beta-1,3-galactosyltransferase 5 [Parasteatoda tepidariorum]|uniref:beta-1,3-galactosyltransferase 5 n=1 Tax=Parasteatoda tepidariorum TaxID=114398 RepID=UPI00077F944D|nr:beta-1,3-galactosyltransferase 5 [Parasteatoda tepidariorum]